MRLGWHIHRDPRWQVEGGYRYDSCRCGARRVRLYRDLHTWFTGPRRSGWPTLRDRHNRRTADSGWWPMPVGGWPETVCAPLTDHLTHLPDAAFAPKDSNR